ncbi:hypothetical protein Krad_2180 [Kineococcus radiotolerans SRS30216 = ATCC BAA-149]|uniref:Uncharacterized protein n=1 Tax=Kineococcus radiotolerans (strain ATCC BAA-149 / DSM 14245 / SRS30216) TaxID=266940 RepID=A6WA24_KINRD|nr:hypothetical protein Krad_2180 [Kineococcus radiotolerans SRS30216 = ATCC BAA-149]
MTTGAARGWLTRRLSRLGATGGVMMIGVGGAIMLSKRRLWRSSVEHVREPHDWSPSRRGETDVACAIERADAQTQTHGAQRTWSPVRGLST